MSDHDRGRGHDDGASPSVPSVPSVASWPLEQAVRILGWSGAVAGEVGLLGQRVHAVAQIDHEEHSQRVARGLTFVEDYPMLDLLQNLPLGIGVPGPTAPGSGPTLERARAVGAVTVDGALVTRRLRRPCAVTGVVRVARRRSQWTVLQELSLFAPLCPRAMLTVGVRARTGAATQLEAATLGIGMVRWIVTDERTHARSDGRAATAPRDSDSGQGNRTEGEGALEVALEVPAQPTRPRLSTGQWLMSELVYAAWLRGTT